MSEHRYDKNIGSCVDPNPLRVERQDPDNFPRLKTRERCALEIAAYVFNMNQLHLICHSQTPGKGKYINSEKLLLVLSLFLIEESTKLQIKIE